jgi:hypothetical protein
MLPVIQIRWNPLVILRYPMDRGLFSAVVVLHGMQWFIIGFWAIPMT